MHNLTAIILLCFTFGLGFNLKAQNTQDEIHSSVEELDSFPISWLGNWTGDLNIYSGNKLVQTVPMELELLAMDTSDNFTWAIIYGADREAGRRSYELEIVDAERGFYRIDEKNSIKMESFLYGNKLFCQFSVMNSQILCTYEKAGEKLIFEIISGNTEPISTTGGAMVDEEEIPEVHTFPISTMQKAVLTRKK